MVRELLILANSPPMRTRREPQNTSWLLASSCSWKPLKRLGLQAVIPLRQVLDYQKTDRLAQYSKHQAQAGERWQLAGLRHAATLCSISSRKAKRGGITGRIAVCRVKTVTPRPR